MQIDQVTEKYSYCNESQYIILHITLLQLNLSSSDNTHFKEVCIAS